MPLAILGKTTMGAVYTTPAGTITIPTFYVAPFNGDPLSGGTEITGSGIARQPLSNASPTMDMGTGIVTSAADLTFPQATSDWSAPWTHYALMTASTGGSVFQGKAITNTRTIYMNDIPKLLAGEITLGYQ